MFSMPPATAALMLPSAISCAAETIACAPEPQTRLTVSAGTVTGRLAWTAACRAGFILVPACTTLPMTTVSTSSGFSPARLTAAPIATGPRAGAGTSLRLHDNGFHLVRVQPGSLNRGADRHSTESGSWHILEAAAKSTDSGANRFGKND